MLTPVPGVFWGKLWKVFYSSVLSPGQVGLHSAIFPLHPALFQIKCQCKEQQLSANIGLSCGQKPTEPEIILQ